MDTRLTIEVIETDLSRDSRMSRQLLARKLPAEVVHARRYLDERPLSPSYGGLTPASLQASRAARGSSRKAGTKPELMLRRALWRRGLRYRKNCSDLPGKPDIVFRGPRVALFVDGDFWHGRDWPTLKAKLTKGHNAAYWLQKIERNAVRDHEHDRRLRAAGWLVVRVWESDVHRDVDGVVRWVETAVRRRRTPVVSP